MNSLQKKYLSKLTFSIEQMSTLIAISECKGKQDLFFQQTPEILNSLKQLAIIESSESSNRLEGITAPHARIKALVLKSTAPENRSEQEIAGYRDALALIHESAQYMEFSINVILQLHLMLYRYMPNEGGKWKSVDNEIIERNTDGTIRRVRFKPVSAFKTPHIMQQLVDLYKEVTTQNNADSLVIIPLVILDYLCIHPFLDGNGRTARLITLQLLYHFDYQVGRYVSLERIFEESKQTYYETLEDSSQNWHEGNHNVMPWLNYFWGVLLRAYREFEQRVGSIRTGRGSKSELVQRAVDRKMKPFAISDIESDCPGISRDLIRIVLRRLRDKGIIKPQGKGRGAKWLRVKKIDSEE